MNSEAAAQPLRPACVLTDAAHCTGSALDGQTPEFVAEPSTEEACGEAVRWARREGAALVPRGGGTAIEQGNPLRPGPWGALATTGLAGIREYSPADMVVTLGAGTTLTALQEALGAQGQFLPIDAPVPDRCTLGGIVATNAQGLWRPQFGAPRDRLLGLRAVTADGGVVRAGGKVVKNVAGYDLAKLYAGSWGTLGVITEVTFKTNPLPPARRHLVWRGRSLREATEAGLRVHVARLQPLYLTAALAPAPFLCVGLMGNAEAIDWQAGQIGPMVEEAGLERVDGGPDERALRHLVAGSPAPLIARLSVRPSDVSAVSEAAARVCAGMPDARAAVHIPTGLIDLALGPEPGTARDVCRSIAALVPPGGTVVWPRVPSAWKGSFDVWGPSRGDVSLMRGLKAMLDPEGLFSPGRFMGRI